MKSLRDFWFGNWAAEPFVEGLLDGGLELLLSAAGHLIHALLHI